MRKNDRMQNRLLALAILAGISMTALPAWAVDPTAAGRDLLQASTQLVNGVPGGDIWTPEISKLWANVPDELRKNYVSDPALALPELTVEQQTETKARLRGVFTDARGQQQELVLELSLVDGTWKIADLSAADGSYRLSSVLRAAGESR